MADRGGNFGHDSLRPGLPRRGDSQRGSTGGSSNGGAAGALCGVLGTIIPPLAILAVISLCYDAFSASPVIAALLYGLRLAVAVVVADAAAARAAEGLRGGDRPRTAVMVVVVLLSLATGAGTVWLLAGGAALGWLMAGRGVT